jgi:adenylate cyclase
MRRCRPPNDRLTISRWATPDAETAVERLVAAPLGDGVMLREIWLLRLRALLAGARGDEVAYRDLIQRYRAMATSLGFEGHMAMAKAMT